MFRGRSALHCRRRLGRSRDTLPTHMHHTRDTLATQVYRALEAQRIATRDAPEPLPPHTTGGFPKAEFFASTMPRLPSHLGSSPPSFGDGGGGGTGSGFGGDGVGAGVGNVNGVSDGAGVGCAVNVLAMERLGENLMSLSQVGRLLSIPLLPFERHTRFWGPSA